MSQLSIVIPTLNAAQSLDACLAAVADAEAEIVVADGGSADGTCELAARLGARVIAAPRGRGAQLTAGARAACGTWLLFLHADTVLGPGWLSEVRRFTDMPEAFGRAAYFRLVLNDPGPQARRVERLARWRARRYGLPYGDQGLLIHRGFYGDLGGFKPIPLMEDVDLVRRIGRKRLVPLAAEARTSAERYRRGGWWLRPARNLMTLGLYYLGLPPALLARLYR